MRNLILILFMVFAGSVWLLAQDAATYIDENGKIHITNNPREHWRKVNTDGSTSGSTKSRVFSVSSVAASTPFANIINQASKQYGIDAWLIRAVIKVESDFNPDVVSSAKAKGLMQLMDGTAAMLGVHDSFDPRQNIMAGSRYLRNLLRLYDGNLRLALAAYNAGHGAVTRHGGVPPYKETRRYLKKIAAIYNHLDSNISKAELESSLVVARAIANGRAVVYKYDTANGYAISEIPPRNRDYIVINLAR